MQEVSLARSTTLRAGPFEWTLLAHALVAAGLAVNYGNDQPVADMLVFASVPVVGLGLWALHGRRRARFPATNAAWAAALASSVSVLLLSPGTHVERSVSRLPFLAMALAAVGIVASYAADIRSDAPPSRTLVWLRPVALLALACGLGVWMLRASPAPGIDVWKVHQQGAAALLRGQQVYAPGAIETEDTYSHARLIDIYPYPPLHLVLTTLGFAVTGETRWAQLVSIIVGAVLLRAVARRAAWPAPVPDLLMACLLFHPRGLFVLEQAWGEPLAVPFLGAFVLAAMTGRRWLAAGLLGLFCALKQHYVLYLPAMAFVPGIGLPGIVVAVITLAATYLPFVLTAPAGVWNAVVMHHVNNHFRADSLSLTALLWDARIALPPWIGFVASAASFGAIRGTPRAVGALLLASSLTFLAFYILGRQAFCNYYYLLGATWLFAAASLRDP